MLITEVKEGISIKKGNIFTLSADIGKLKRGDKVTITKVKNLGEDVEVEIINEEGTTDVFYLDPTDNFEESD